MANVIQWFEIPVNDLERAKNFYENVLAVELKEMKTPNGMEMAVFPTESNEAGQQGALIYLDANPDLQDALDRVEREHHGEVVVPKTQITEEHGYMAVIIDSEGNRIALISQK